MAEVNELQELCFIRAVGEHFCAYAVGEKRSGSLAEYAAVVQYAHFPEVGIGIQFMLAAGYGQDEANAACDGIIEGIIRCGIAGMEGDHHVNGFAHVVFRYISCDEMKLIIAVFLRKPVAEGDNILLEVKPRHAHGDMLYLGEIVVNDESEVRFTAAEVDDIKLLIAEVFIAYTVVDTFKKAVDLLEFIVHILTDGP